MSEEILKALTQLFAIISKQDGGVTHNEREFVIRFFQQELDHSSMQEYIALYDSYSEFTRQETAEPAAAKLTSVKDSVKTLGICRKINKTLTQKQKIVVLIKLLEMVGSDNNFTPQRMNIINTVSDVFNLDKDEYSVIEKFVVADAARQADHPTIMLVNAGPRQDNQQKHTCTQLNGDLIVMRVPSVELYFVRYSGDGSQMLNGFVMQPGRIYLFSHGSTIKMQHGDVLYYSDLVADFNEEIQTTRLSFNASVPSFRFKNGAQGLHNVMIAEGPGKLIGIMGASGAGKTTLLNVLAGLEGSQASKIEVNGLNIHTDKKELQGVIGYVSQDDLLIEELTVYQNLYFNAKLCFASLSEDELNARVTGMLESLGLEHRKDLKVGSSLEKTISGGQRKRLNIALELIRQPAILFLDEPTSGLSSRDSENVIDLLKELSLKGKLIFVVIHQPSSDIYKMFDKMIIMDTGGFPAYYGHPVEAITYFKKATHQADSNRGQCEVCGTVNPEQIFNIIEARVVDEYGQPTPKRKVLPVQWHEKYCRQFIITPVDVIKEKPPQSLQLPGRLRQAAIFTVRDFLTKASNKQYLLINLLEAPFLALILAFIIRYKSSPDGQSYTFRFNDNFPAFILMSIIVALFMGLTVSAEEIIRDRKLLKRESFLTLSWFSYLVSKLNILFALSAVQTLSFVVVSHLVLEIHGMTFAFWLMLFTVSCMANVLGLNISSAFNSAVTVYVLIPLLLIPQMILSGVLFNFDKLNNLVSTKGKVPVLADFMASRWAYEGMATHQFINNTYEKPFYQHEKLQSQADFKSGFLYDELKKRNQFVIQNSPAKTDSLAQLVTLQQHILRQSLEHDLLLSLPQYAPLRTQILTSYTPETARAVDAFLETYRERYLQVYNHEVTLMEKKMAFYENNGWDVNKNKDLHYNESLADLVKNVNTKERVLEYKGSLLQLIDPVFQEPVPAHWLDYRTGFFVSEKNLAGIRLSTYTFNVIVIWLMSAGLFAALYFQWLRKGIHALGRFKLHNPLIRKP
jgi:ABC-type multidrug transport system ATPase subunit